MANFSPLKTSTRRYEEATAWLRSHGYEVSALAVTSNACLVRLGQCEAEISPSPDDTAVICSLPALVLGGERATLIDRGYQKFFKTSKFEVAATAEQLRELHAFSEGLKEGLGYTSLYNEGLGSVSQSYQYDRVKGRH